MKIQSSPLKKLQASAMIAVSIFAVLVAGTLAAYLLMVENEYTQVGRSQTWNDSMVLAEAGTEEGMAMVNLYAGVGNFSQITNWVNWASWNGWNQNNSGGNVVYYKTNIVNSSDGSYYMVWITNYMVIPGGVNITPTNPVVVAVGVATWSLRTAKAGGPLFAQATLAPNSQSQATREIYVQTAYQPLFPGAITTETNINMNGNNVTVNSFDSSDPTASDWVTNWGYGTYDTSNHGKWHANGNVSTDSTVTDAISVGNANIYGHLNVGPGGTTYVQNNGSVGNVAWVDGGNSGIQTGYSSDDMNVAFPAASLPSGSYTLLPSTTTNISSSGYYQFNSTPSSLTVSAPNVTIYYPSGFSLSGNGNNAGFLNVAVGASVAIYTGGSISVSGKANINNLAQNANDLAIYALPGVTSIGMNGNAGFTGTIYAPSATFSFGGGGNNTYDYVGALVALSVTMNGHANFHYDENLARKGPGRGYFPTNWKEVVKH